MISVDQKLIDGVNKGDEQAFRSLFDSYWSYLCSVAAMYVPDSCAVEEIVGDVFMSIWNHRGQYRAPIRGYLVGSVRNACVSHLRSKMLKARLRESYEKNFFFSHSSVASVMSIRSRFFQRKKRKRESERLQTVFRNAAVRCLNDISTTASPPRQSLKGCISASQL